jgi:hypothetical protein
MAILYYGVLFKQWEKHPLLLSLAGVLGFLCVIAGLGCDLYASLHYKVRRPDLVPPPNPECYIELCHLEKEQKHLWGLIAVHCTQM